jgi:hypothetical protein
MLTTVFAVVLCGMSTGHGPNVAGYPLRYMCSAPMTFHRTEEECVRERDRITVEDAKRSWPPAGSSYRCISKPVTVTTFVD